MSRKYRTENQEQKTESSSSPIKAIFDKFAKHRDVNLVYGDPITHGEQRVIPVTKMRYSFGGGSGGKKNNKNEDSSNVRGDSGGGHISVKPVGVYQLKKNDVKFKPIIDLKYIFPMFSLLSLGLAFILRKK